MADFNRDLKLVKVDDNHILATDSNKKIIATDITVEKLRTVVQDSVKTIYIQSVEEADLNPSDDPDLIAKFQTILDNITFDASTHDIKAFPTIYMYISAINGFVGTNIYINTSLYTIYIEADYIASNVADTITDDSATYKEYHPGIEIKTDEHFEEIVYTKYKTNISYTSKTYDVLSTQSTLNGNAVTYVPQKDGQPANKKYVDAQDALLDTRITALETATTNIGNRLDEINGEVIN